MITGKPRIAINVPLLDALEAMLEIMVNVTEKPNELSKRLNTNIPISSTGFPNSSIYTIKPTYKMKFIIIQLKISFEIMIESVLSIT